MEGTSLFPLSSRSSTVTRRPCEATTVGKQNHQDDDQDNETDGHIEWPAETARRAASEEDESNNETGGRFASSRRESQESNGDTILPTRGESDEEVKEGPLQPTAILGHGAAAAFGESGGESAAQQQVEQLAGQEPAAGSSGPSRDPSARTALQWTIDWSESRDAILRSPAETTVCVDYFPYSFIPYSFTVTCV